MALRQIKVPVKTKNGCCDTLCSECASVVAVVDRGKTVDQTGIINGAIVPRAFDSAALFIEGGQCFVNFEYDDVQLAVGEVLVPCDICLVCGCVVDLIRRQGHFIADIIDPTREFISPFETIQYEGTNLTTVDVISPVGLGPTRVVVDTPCSAVRTCFSAVDTATVDYTYNAVTGVHQADVNISAVAGNDIVVNPDGLYVNISSANCAEVRQCLSVVDTPSVNMSYNPVSGVFSSDVRIDPTPGNQVSITPNGLLVPPAAAPASDSLVDNGDRTFTHTAVSGAVQNFCQGVQTIVGTNNCASGGIGNGFALRSATFNGCQLTLNGAPEHTTISGSQSFTSGPTGNLFNGDTFNGPEHTTVIENPSQCRAMRLHFMQSGEWSSGRIINTANNTSDCWINLVNDFINTFGGPVPNGSLLYKPSGAGSINQEISSSNMYHGSVIIPPGGSFNLTSQNRLRVPNTSAPNDSIEFNGASVLHTWIGSTI